MTFDKHFLCTHVGIAISTYTNEKTDKDRYKIIDKSLASLKKIIHNNPLKIYVVIVVDGKVPDIHMNLLKKYKFDIYNRKENGGVARTKNTSIRLLLEKNVDIGYLADDDVEYKEKCIQEYTKTIVRGKIHHIGFTQMSPIVHPKSTWKKMGYYRVKYNNQNIMRHGGGGVGCWLSFTPELIKKIGYFRVMPGKYGYEHINFTHRCINQKIIPYGVDIIDSSNYLDHIGFEPVKINLFKKNHSIDEKYRQAENKKNENVWKKDLHKYYPCIE